LGLDGYCPVTLLKRDVWKQGDPRYGIVHRGRLYMFAGERERNVFSGNPDDYSPVLAGVDPVHLAASGEPVEGKRTHGVVYRKRVYLFSSEENLQRFWQNPERFAAPIRQAMEAGTVSRLFR
jgi:protein disulfide-isomerase